MVPNGLSFLSRVKRSTIAFTQAYWTFARINSARYCEGFNAAEAWRGCHSLPTHDIKCSFRVPISRVRCKATSCGDVKSMTSYVKKLILPKFAVIP